MLHSKSKNQFQELLLKLAQLAFSLSTVVLLLFIIFILNEGYLNLRKQNEELSDKFNSLQAQQIEFESKFSNITQNQNQETKPNPPAPDSNDRRLGDLSSRYTLMVYVDFECPFCKQAHPVEKAFYEQNKSEMSLVLRHFPIESIHPNALKKSQIAECAFNQKGNQGFFEAVDNIFSTESIETLPTKQMAGILDLNDTQLGLCLSTGQGLDIIKEQQRIGTESNIPGTPTMFLYDQESGRLELLDSVQSLSDLQSKFENFKSRN